MEIKIYWFNQWCNFYLKSLGWKRIDERKIKVSDGVYRLTYYRTIEGVMVYTYGFMENDKGKRPGHGGEWSSRPEQINKIFNKKIMDVALKEKGDSGCYYSFAVDQSWMLSQLAPGKFKVHENDGKLTLTDPIKCEAFDKLVKIDHWPEIDVEANIVPTILGKIKV